MKRLQKRPFLLLEALIAFALIVLCVLPLIYPHVGMLKAQQRFVHRIELDHVVNILYGDVIEKLYVNKIGWNDLLAGTHKVDAGTVHDLGYTKPFPFVGTFGFKEILHKPKKESPYMLYLLSLTFNFLPIELQNASDEVKKDNMISYEYKVMVVRDLRQKGGAGTP